MRKALWIGLALWALCGSAAMAQRGFGFRFASEFNHFFRSQEHPELIDGSWSHIVIGPYYQAYFTNGGAQLGLNFIYKNNTDRGFPNLPVVQRDYKGAHNVGVTALEVDLKVGPEFGIFHPKIGYLMGYRFKQEGFLNDGQTAELNRLYVSLPFGFTVDLPTQYGSTGVGLFYNVGLTSVMKNPDPRGFQDYDGSRVRSIRVEIVVMFESGDQKRK